MHYTHQYVDENTYQVARYFDNGDSQNCPPDNPNYLKWISDGNIPVLEAKGRFLLLVDGQIVVDPNKTSILAAEESARLVNQARIAAKAQVIIDNLPSLATVNAGINNAFPDAKQNAFMTKLCNVIYWDIKNEAD